METKDTDAILWIVWKWRKRIFFAVVVGSIISAIVLLTLPNYYKASTTFYPVSSDLLKPIFDGSDRDLLYYGDDRDVDRLLSIAQSSELAREMIRKFDLAGHYGIDTSSIKGKRKLRKKFNKLYSAKKTTLDAITVSVEDKDPEFAASIANGAREGINTRAQAIVQAALGEVVAISEKSLSDKENRLGEITDRIQGLREEYNIYDTQSQGEALATLEVRSPQDSRVKEYIQGYASGVSRVINLETEQIELSKLIARQRDDLESLRASLSAQKNAIHIIEEATTPDEKSRPRRSLLLLASMVVITAMAVLIALTAEKIASMNTLEKQH